MANDTQTTQSNQGNDEKKLERAATSLRSAAAGGFVTLVELLLDKHRPKGGASDPEKTRYRDKFLNGKDKDGNTPLYHAAFAGHTLVVEALLNEEGIDVNIKNERDWTPLRAALGTDNAEAAELIADEQTVDGTKRFHKNWNPLCHAASNNHIHVVKLLLEKSGVSTDVPAPSPEPVMTDEERKKAEKEREKEIDQQDGDGMTALYLAASKGHLRVVKALLKKNASVTAESKGYLMPLYGAALGGHARIVRYLLQQPNIERAPKTFEGETPLDAAVKGGHTKVAELLMDAIENAPSTDSTVGE